MPYYWTCNDSRNAIFASIVPASLGIYKLTLARKDQPFSVFIKNSVKPRWAERVCPFGVAAIDLAVLTPLGYASYLVYKFGGGFDYTDTTVALALYGTNLLANFAAIPLVKKRDYKGIAITKAVVFATALATFVAFRGIDEKAGWYVVPYALWSAFASFFAFKLHQLNSK
ncbi:hypothetical protein FO519_006940 [Halicephalobus sp. NKZ332]|nr:hypothetical protein FO519_006940 [Halicephalobus sp. NKZ332]